MGRCIKKWGFLIFTLGFSILNGQVKSDFSASEREGCGSLQVNFFDQSVSPNANIVSWRWDLGGTISIQQNPGAIFDVPGSYRICLTVTDSNGDTNQNCMDNYINIYTLPEVDFAISTTAGCNPLDVTFINTSKSNNGAITSLIWDVGGSSNVVNSNDPNEAIRSTYNEGGLYSTTLIVVDEKGCSETKGITDAITVFEIEPAKISTDIISFCSLPWEISIKNDFPDPETNYIWDFGNGETFEGIHPPNIFYQEGVYDLIVYQEKGGCVDSTLFENFINTRKFTQISINPDTVCINAPTMLKDESYIKADSLVWIFEDGSISTTDETVYKFTRPGCNQVRLIRYVQNCIDTLEVDCINVRDHSDFSFSMDNQFGCKTPASIGLFASSQTQGTFQWKVNGIGSFDGPIHQIDIQEFGVYDASVSFTNPEGCINVLDTLTIPVVEFEGYLPFRGPQGCTPLSFNLVDSVESSLPIISYQWQIGNPVIFSSTEASPSFEISEIGRYDVTLIVENQNGCLDTIFRPEYIQVGEPIEIDFFATPLNECLVSQRSFTSIINGNVDNFFWDFGDGGTSFKSDPEYFYTTIGVFEVALTAFFNGCPSTITKADYINVAEPISKFKIKYNCEDPHTVELKNESLGADSLYWVIHLNENQQDTLRDSLLMPFTFPSVGDYVIEHYTMNTATGCEHLKIDTARIRNPIANYILDTLQGCKPLTIQLIDKSISAQSFDYSIPGGKSSNPLLIEQNITYSTGGTFAAPTLIIEDIHECQDTFNLIDSIRVNEIVPLLIYKDVVCVPNNEDFIDSSYSLFGDIVYRLWNIDDSTQISNDPLTTFIFDTSRFYSLYYEAEDSWGCTVSIRDNDIEGITVDPDFSVDTLGCTTSDLLFRTGINDPNVNFYLWEFGDGNTSNEKNATHRYEAEGTYSVCLTIENNRGCAKKICKENIILIKNPKADFVGDPTFDTCPPLLSSFNNNSTNATAFIWDFGDQSGQSRIEAPSHVYTVPGTFSVSLIAELTPTCRDTLTKEDYIQVLGPVGQFDILVDTSCVPLGVTFFASSDDIYQYIWDFGNGVIDSVDELTIIDTTQYSYEMTGKYVPKLFIIDDGGCKRTFSSDPIRVDDVDLNFSISGDPLCGPPLISNIDNESNSSSDAQYSWEFSGPQTVISTEENPQLIFEESGIYDASLFVQAGYCFDTLIKEQFVEIGDLPAIDFDIEESIFCKDIAVHFMNTSTVDYGNFIAWEWDFGDGTKSDLFEPTHTFNASENIVITLTGYTDIGCEAKSSKNIEILPSSQISVIDDFLICIGDEGQLEASIDNWQIGGNILWSGESSLSCTDCLTPNIQPTTTSVYYFEAKHPNGCLDIDSVVVTVIPTPGPTIKIDQDTTVCLGSNATIQVYDFNTDYSYQWANDPGLDCYIDCQTILANPSENTLYSVTVSNEYGCVNFDSILVEVETSFTDFLVDKKTICEDASTQLFITNGNNPQWESIPGLSCTNCDTTIISPSTAQYYFVDVESDLGCKYQDSIFVDIVPSESVGIISESVRCVGEEIQLQGSGIGIPAWTPADQLNHSNILDPKGNLFETTTFVLTMTADECIQKDSVEIEVLTKAEIAATGDTICPFDLAQLSASGLNIDAYRWEDKNEKVYDGPNLSIELEENTVFQAIGSFRTCIEDTAIVEVFVHPKINIELDKFYTIFSNKAAEVNLEADRVYEYMWSPAVGLSCDDCPEPIINNVFEENIYDLKITDPISGCMLNEEITVRYTSQCTQDVWGIPNIFSPNGDNQNDGFRLYTTEQEAFVKMSIFDRWGNLIFTGNEIEKEWDGKHQGIPAITGVYPMRLDAICTETQEEYFIYGTITLIR